MSLCNYTRHRLWCRCGWGCLCMGRRRDDMKGFLEILMGLVMVALTGCVNESEEPVWSLQVGDRLPEFEVVLNNGDQVTTESLRGSDSVIVFFNTSCGDCRRELPEIQKLYDECLRQNRPVRFICISREEGAASVAKFWEENNLTMPYSAQTDRRVYNLFASSGIPRLYEADKNLMIIKVNEFDN